MFDLQTCVRVKVVSCTRKDDGWDIDIACRTCSLKSKFYVQTPWRALPHHAIDLVLSSRAMRNGKSHHCIRDPAYFESLDPKRYIQIVNLID